MQFSCPRCMATFRLPDTAGVPAEVRCKHCGERISLMASLGAPPAQGPAPGTPRAKPRVTAANQAVQIRVPTAVRKLGFEPRATEPVDEDGVTRSEPVPEALAHLAAPRPVPSPPADPSVASPARGAGAASLVESGAVPANSRAGAPHARPRRPLPTARERPVPTAVSAALPTASRSQPPQPLHPPGPSASPGPGTGSSRLGAEDDVPTRAYPVPEGPGQPGVDSSEAATVMRRTPAGLTRAAARYRRTSPAVAVQRPSARLPDAPGPRPGSQGAPRGATPPQRRESWAPSPALWGFVGALLGAAVIALLFALLR